MLVLSVLGLGRPMPDGESPIFRLKAEATDRVTSEATDRLDVMADRHTGERDDLKHQDDPARNQRTLARSRDLRQL